MNSFISDRMDGPVSLALIWLFSWGSGITNATPIFDYRENVNLLNARDVIITAIDQDNGGTAFRSGDAQHLTFAREAASALSWEGDVGVDGNASLTIDFQRQRNIKTIRSYAIHANYGFLDGQPAFIETSDDGVNWTSQGNTVSSITTAGTITLNAAVDARYLRISNPNPQNATRWRVTQLRVFGDTGSLTNSHGSLDLVSSTGFNVGMTLSAVGTVSAYSLPDFINDAADPISRKLLWNVGSGEGFVLNMGQSFNVETFGVVLGDYLDFDSSPTFTIATSLNGVDYTTRINGTSQVVDENEFSLGGVEAQYIRFVYTSTTNPDTRISDIYAYAVPEPGALVLMGIGGWMLFWFRRSLHRS